MLRALALGTGLAYAAFSVLVGLYVAVQNTVPGKKPPRAEPGALAAGAERVRFTAEDGVRLEGLFAPPAEGRPVVVVQHGKRANRDNLLPWARILAEVGYGVLAFDWRSHGASEGDVISHGIHEPKDLVAALDLLAGDPRSRGRPVGILALSLGAACTAMTAPRLPEAVKGLVLDSPYGDLGRMADERLAKYGLLALGAGKVVDLYTWMRVGVPTRAVVPEKALAAFAPRPILVLHGDADLTIPVAEGRSLVAAYPGPKEYWETPGDGHCAARTTRTRDWMGRVAGFFARCLPGAPDPAAVVERTPARLEEVRN